jgi:hypothetical protein
MRIYNRPLFDEISIGKFHIQFFSLNLWQWGVRYFDGAIALPTMSIRKAK